MRAAPQKWLYICVEVLQVPVIHQKGQLVEQHCPLDKSYPLLHDVHTSVGFLVAKEHWWGYAPTAAISPFMILVSRATKEDIKTFIVLTVHLSFTVETFFLS